MYRVPFVVSSFGVCLLVFFRSKQALFLRLLPLMFLGTFSSLYNYHIGQYGVYRKVDEFYKFLGSKEGTEVGERAK